MDTETIAMICAGFAVLATLVSWVFYAVAGKSLWDIRGFLRGTPGDREQDASGPDRDHERSRG